MSNTDIKKNWKPWYPEEIFLKKLNKNYSYFWNLQNLTEEDFHLENENKKNCKKIKKIDKLEISSLKKEMYNSSFQDNIKKKEQNILLTNNFDKLLSSFDASISLFEEMLFTRLLKTILIISSYVIGKEIKIDKSILLKNIKKIIHEDNFFLEKKKLIVHPNNKKILEKIIKNSIHSDKWELYYDNNIDVNGCKIRSENGGIDNTIKARWNELCRLVSEEC